MNRNKLHANIVRLTALYLLIHLIWFGVRQADKKDNIIVGHYKVYDESCSLKNYIEEEINKTMLQKIEDTVQAKPIKTTVRQKKVTRSVPTGRTSMKTYMDYRKITSKSSKQYQFQQREDIYTDDEGFRRIGDRYIVAIGTYFSKNIGDCLEIVLSSGTVFEAVVGDIKNDKHTDETNRQHLIDGSVLEFLVDAKKLDKTIKKMGDISYATNANLKGNVVGISILGHIDDEIY